MTTETTIAGRSAECICCGGETESVTRSTCPNLCDLEIVTTTYEPFIYCMACDTCLDRPKRLGDCDNCSAKIDTGSDYLSDDRRIFCERCWHVGEPRSAA